MSRKKSGNRDSEFYRGGQEKADQSDHWRP